MIQAGLWVNDQEFRRFTTSFSDAVHQASTEIATRSLSVDGLTTLFRYLPNPDPILRKAGKSIEIYTELLSDAHVSATSASRKSGVLRKAWQLDRGKAKSRPAQIIEAMFNDLDVRSITSEMLDAVFFGYQPLEVVWQRVGPYIMPAKVQAKPSRWFVFDQDNALRFRTLAQPLEGIALPPMRFLVAQYEAKYENPYGQGTLSKCFWPVLFKRGGIKFWVQFLERFGTPSIIGKLPRGAQEKEIQELLDMLDRILRSSVGVIPDDSSVDVMSSDKSGSTVAHRELLHFCDQQISKATLGQTLTTQIDGVGSYAASQTGMEVQQALVDADTALTTGLWNELIKWIYTINFGSGPRPSISFVEETKIDTTKSERDKNLRDAGVVFTKQYWMREYSLEEGDIEDTPKPQEVQPTGANSDAAPAGDTPPSDDAPAAEPASDSATSTNFADRLAADRSTEHRGQLAIDALRTEVSPDYLQHEIENVLQPALALIRDGASYTEVMEALAERSPELDTAEIEQSLARAIFLSEVWGQSNAATE